MNEDREQAGDGAPRLDLSQARRVHVVGVGGAGMSAIASVLASMGHRVTGSDLKASAATARLGAAGIEVSIGHDAAHIGDAEVVAVSTAISPTNPEVAEARRLGLPVLPRAEVLAAIAACRRCVAVSGTHGKTTTTSMLALILIEAGLRPSFLIGGDVNEIGTNAVWDSGAWLVVEADESDGTFLFLNPEIAVVTNIEPDHLDFYGDFESLVVAFDRFCAQRPGGVVAGADNLTSAEVAARHAAATVGVSGQATFRIIDVEASGPGVSFRLLHDGVVLGSIELPVTGANIAANAAVATVAAMAVGASFDDAAHALARFAGVARRFEVRGEVDGVQFVDDYAHLPTEVSAVIEAAKAGHRGRLVVVFQPHRYSRVASLWERFADAFVGADVVIVTDVFPAGEAPVPGVTGRLVVDAVVAAHPGSDVTYMAGRSELRSALHKTLRRGDLCLTLGAGDLTSLPDELMATGSW